MEAKLQHAGWEQPPEFPQLCRFLAERSPQPMVAVEGPTHIVRYANRAFHQLLGTEDHHLMGRPFAEAVPEGMANGCAPLLDRVFATGTPEVLAEQEHGRGALEGEGGAMTTHWSYRVWAILGPVSEPAGGAKKPVGVMIQVTDATEVSTFRKAAAAINEALLVFGVRQHELTGEAEKLTAELRESEARLAGQKEAFEAAVNGASIAISLQILARTAMGQGGGDARAAFFIVDADGACLHPVAGAGVMPESYARCVDGLEIGPNSPSCGMAAYLGRPVIVRDVTEDPLWEPWLHIAQEHDFRACWSFPIQTYAGRVVGTFAMYFREPRDAGPRDLELAGILTHAAAIIISRDTEAQERKRAEEALRRSEAHEREAKQEAEAANHSKDLFLAMLSHELRTPLNAIVGWMSILRAEGCEEADWHEGLDVIDRNTRMQVQLIEDVLDVSRIISGKMRLETKPSELTEVVKAGLDVVRAAAEAKNITLKTELDPAANRAFCDAVRMQQVVWNLLSNAVKFTPKGGTVSVRLSREQSAVKIRVSDTGQGMSAELVPFVFERYRQADSSTRRKFGGLGLGLFIVKQLVEMHGGTVEAHSEGEGRGSTFTVRLPIRAVRALPDESGGEPGAGDESEDAAPSGLPVVRLDGLRLLVVDDEADARRLLTKVLEQAGATVTAAGSAAEAMQLVPKVNPQVLVSDVGMPGEDGFDLMRQVRKAGYTARDLPAVALTAFVHEEDRRQALLAGFQVHVPKPVDPHDLTVVIASLAGRTG